MVIVLYRLIKFSSPEVKAHVSFSDHILSGVRLRILTFSLAPQEEIKPNLP